VYERYQEFTLLKVQIKTGRTHQIRVHLAHIGHPVVGDSTYGAGREKSVRQPSIKRAVNELGRQFLHSAELAFDHPRTDKRLQFSAPLPSELTTFLAEVS
jgi:23S rRNA pseudouridine1911/1915/1917 synthase